MCTLDLAALGMSDWLLWASVAMTGALLVATVWDVVYWNAVARCDTWAPDNEAAAGAQWMLLVYQLVLSVTFTRVLTSVWLHGTAEWKASAHRGLETAHTAAWAGVDASVAVLAALRLFYFAGVEDGYRAAHYPDSAPRTDYAWWAVGAVALVTLVSRLLWLRRWAV